MPNEHIYDIPAILSLLGIHDVVISPGSRSAPLVLAFNRHPKMRCYVVPDERSAAFIALGMSLKSKQPTVLVCTSGSAAYNYAPAVAEAYFQQVPLLVLTADRPPEWIDQWDGQTIRQQDIFGKHVIKSYQLPTAALHPDELWHVRRIVNEAALLTNWPVAGPVHINVPLREPIYPLQGEEIKFPADLRVFRNDPSPRPSMAQLKSYFDSLPAKILIVCGQMASDNTLWPVIERLASKIPVATDAQSNLSAVTGCITHHDLFLSSRQESGEFQPDLLITIGKTVISKNLKTYLRKNKPAQHWVVSDQLPVADTYQSLTRIVHAHTADFLTALEQTMSNTAIDQGYLKSWEKPNAACEQVLADAFADQLFSEFEAVQTILNSLPTPIDIHVANSMAIRYVNFLGVRHIKQEVFVNRGTSGIDGSVSTAVGCAISSGGPTALITGDLAFFYDRNGLWHQHLPDHFVIFLINNHGGGIFGMINGPKQQPELERFFITEQRLTAANTAQDFGMGYYQVSERDQLLPSIQKALSADKPTIIEITTSTRINETVFNNIKAKITP